MSAEAAKDRVRGVITRIFNGRDLAHVDEAFASDFRFFPPGSRDATDRNGFKEFIGMFQTAFPDARWALEEMVGEADRVAFRVEFTGTHENVLMDIPPTGRVGRLSGFAFMHFSGDEVQELRALNDRLGLLQQLGVAPGERS